MKRYPLNCLQCFKKKQKKHFTSLLLSGQHCVLSHHGVEVGAEVLKFKPWPWQSAENKVSQCFICVLKHVSIYFLYCRLASCFLSRSLRCDKCVSLLPPAGRSPSLQWLSCACWAPCGSLAVSSLRRAPSPCPTCSPSLAAFKGSCSSSCTAFFPNRSVPIRSETKRKVCCFCRCRDSVCIYCDSRWGKSMETSCPDAVHRGRRATQSSVPRTPAELRWALINVGLTVRSSSFH